MLSQKARYALRALLDLAGKAGETPVPLANIAARQAVPHKFLEAIMRELGRAGLVTSRRGPGGGFALGRAAHDISFAEIIRVVDGPLALVPCASVNFYARCGDCHDEATCAIRRAMLSAREAVDGILSRVTLESAQQAEAAAGADPE